MTGSQALDTQVDRQALMMAESEDESAHYTSTDAILYALGVGFGDGRDLAKETAYLYEEPTLKTVPAFATTLINNDMPGNHGWDGRQAVHVEHKLELYRPLPASGSLLTRHKVVEVEPVAAGPGTRVLRQAEARMASDDTALFTLGSVMVSRAADAFRARSAAMLVEHAMPRRDPDLSCDIRTRTDQSFLFRLSGDRHPLYVDPRSAEAAGFDGPLLESRCLLGIACRAILRTICDYDYTLIRGIEAIFSAPVYPGDTVTTDMWQDRNIVSFRCLVKSRRSIVISAGKCTLA